MKHKTPLLMIPAVLLLIGTASGQSIAPYSAEQFPDITVRPNAIGYEGSLYVLTNDSDRAITGLTTMWRYTDGEGKAKQFTVSSDSYSASKLTPVVAPHAKILLDDDPQYAAHLSNATNVQVSIDSLIYEDGEITGPDSLHFAEDIGLRFQAAKVVLQRLRMAKISGKPLTLEDNRRVLPQSQDWLQNYTEHARRAESDPRMAEAFLRYLDSLQAPPTFHRANQ